MDATAALRLMQIYGRDTDQTQRIRGDWAVFKTMESVRRNQTTSSCPEHHQSCTKHHNIHQHYSSYYYWKLKQRVWGNLLSRCRDLRFNDR